MTTVLVAGATGMLGSKIADQLLHQPDTDVRLLVRAGWQENVGKSSIVHRLVAAGAEVVIGDVSQPDTLDAATRNVDVVVSALQGGPDVIVEGQVSLAEAAVSNGVRRFLPSDFAIDLFNAPAGPPSSLPERTLAVRSKQRASTSSTCSTEGSWT